MKIKNISLVVFDLDGTLIDAYPAITKSFNYTMSALKYKTRSPGVIKRAVGFGDRRLLQPFVNENDLDAALKIYRRHHADSLVKYSRLMPGVRALLSGLKKREYMLAVASNRPSRFSNILLKHLDIRKFFDFVLCGDKISRMKPHPQILRIIMARFKVKPGRALFVGDMVIDAVTGRRAGVRTVMVPTGSSSRSEISKEKPLLIIPRVKDLSGLLF
ncbi:MAG: HAD-IA family hydrolase [Candidatus Omnitrophica bacterium]|jgi:phosphoglycolate phosphatase|nr:HAD-IA family hydrolase [Candidatus Omnitrophota bacterium]